MKWGARLLVAAVVAAVVNLATVWALPWLVNQVVLHRITERIMQKAQAQGDSSDPLLRTFARQALARQGRNVAVHVPPITAASRAVVRPSPDLLYTACVFDVSQRPLHIHAVAADGYVSVSAFGSDTSNFFVRDVTAGSGEMPRTLDVVLVHGRTPATLPRGAVVVRAPDARGLVLFRTLITDPARIQHLRQSVQLQQSCNPVLKP